MKPLALILFFALAASAQFTTFPPSGGTATGVAPYSMVFAGQTTLTATAATHGQGTKPGVLFCRPSSGADTSGWVATVNGSGDITVVPAAGGAYTGTCQIVAGNGIQGATGAMGPAPNVTVGTTTTSAPGSSASVVRSGPDSAPVLSFSIPRGDTGATGATGPAGPAGAANVTGSMTSATTVTVNHACGTAAVMAAFYDSSGGKVSPATDGKTDNDNYYATFSPALTGTYTVNCSGGPGSGGGGAVSSVFGRTGAVTAAANDYAFTDISGTLAVNKGGTGATTAAAARMNLLPSYTSNGGKCVAVNSGATDVEYVTCGTGGSYTQGAGISISGGVISADPATVPTRITGTASLTMSTFTNSCEEGTITVSGAATGDEVMIGAPNGIGAGLLWSAYVSSTNTVTLRVCRINGTATLSGATFRATIIRSF